MAQQDLERAFAHKPNDVATLISIYPLPIDETKPGLIPAQYLMPAVKNPLEDVEVLHIYRARFPVYLDENRPALVVPAPSDEVAESICRDFKVSMHQYEGGVSEPGIFWLPGKLDAKTVKVTHDAELKKMRELQIEWFKRIVAQGDDDWGQFHMRRMISPIQRIACSLLKLDKPWNDDTKIEQALSMVPCKFCRADLKPGAIICQFCRGILDMKAYQESYKEAGAAVK